MSYPENTSPGETKPDFHLDHYENVVILYPRSELARRWVSDTAREELVFWDVALVVEHRYLPDLLTILQNEGFKV